MAGMLLKTLAWAAGLTLFLWGVTRLMENRMTYYPFSRLEADPSYLAIDYEDIFFETGEGLRLHGWYCTPSTGEEHRADLLFFHGNGGNISHRLSNIRGLVDAGLGVFIFDYRGYGLSQGRTSDAGVLEDARAAAARFRELTEGSGRPAGIFGRSLGSLLAVRQASGNAWISFLIMEGSFPGRRAFIRRYPPFWPFYLFTSRKLDMAGFQEGIACPAMVMHARQDEVIPFALGRQVHRGMNPGAVFYEIPAGGHNDAFAADANYYPTILAFLEKNLRI